MTPVELPKPLGCDTGNARNYQGHHSSANKVGSNYSK